MDYLKAIEIAVEALKRYEGFRSTAYPDVNGYAIGYGNHYYEDGSPVKKGDTITRAQAERLLPLVVIDKERAIRPYIDVNLYPGQYAALLSLAYNCGEGRVRDSTVLKLINAGAPQEVIKDQYLKTCITAGGIYNPDLHDRRCDEWNRLWMMSRVETLGLVFLAAIAIGLYKIIK